MRSTFIIASIGMPSDLKRLIELAKDSEKGSPKRQKKKKSSFACFGTRDRWVAAYLWALECDTPILEAVFLRFRSYSEIFNELGPEKLMPKINFTSAHSFVHASTIVGFSKPLMYPWWKRFKELMGPKLIHQFGKDSPFSNILFWFGCERNCEHSTLDVVHYPVNHIEANGNELYFMTCVECLDRNIEPSAYAFWGRGDGFQRTFVDYATLHPRLANAKYFIGDSEKARPVFDDTDAMHVSATFGEVPGTRILFSTPYGPKETYFASCSVSEDKPMRVSRNMSLMTLDFTTACLMLNSSRIAIKPVGYH